MMFRITPLFLAILACMSAAVSFAIPLSDLDNKHNLSNQSNNTFRAQPLVNDGTDQICIFCHTPHSATPDSPLWSRPDPATSTFPIYGNPLVIAGSLGTNPSGQTSRSQYNTADVYPNGASRMCLSCHDGVTAIGLLNDSTTINMLGPTTLSGYNSAINLEASHPISFVYVSGVVTDLETYYGADSYTLPSTADAIDTPLDGQSRMQCTTCHDPHEDTRAGAPGGLPFWRENTGNDAIDYDAVCDACHGASFNPGGPTGDHQIPKL